jgi:hypothetical protein
MANPNEYPHHTDKNFIQALGKFFQGWSHLGLTEDYSHELDYDMKLWLGIPCINLDNLTVEGTLEITQWARHLMGYNLDRTQIIGLIQQKFPNAHYPQAVACKYVFDPFYTSGQLIEDPRSGWFALSLRSRMTLQWLFINRPDVTIFEIYRDFGNIDPHIYQPQLGFRSLMHDWFMNAKFDGNASAVKIADDTVRLLGVPRDLSMLSRI